MLRRQKMISATPLGTGRPALMLCLLAIARTAVADEPAAEIAGTAAPASEPPASLPSSLELLDASTGMLSSAILPDGGMNPRSDDADAPAHELASGLTVQVGKNRRKFRARAVNWMAERSVAAGTMTDFLLGGADSGWHLVADVTGTDEYVLEWKARFR